MAFWVRVSNDANKCLLLSYTTDFVFSPDVKYVGAISEDGCLRVIDALAEQCVIYVPEPFDSHSSLQAR